MGGILETLLKNWESISIGAVLMLLLLGAGYLFFTDKLQSPKSVERMVAEIVELKKAHEACESKCDDSDKTLQKAAAELADAKIIYVRAEARIEHLETVGRMKDQELADIRSRFGRLEGELEGLKRWCQRPANFAGERQ
jgi:chromosome segregation ATPase